MTSLADHLETCVKNGATLILTARSGVKNMNNVCWMRPLPGPLADAAGTTVAEYDPIGNDIHAIRTKSGKTYSCSQWCDILEPAGAETIAWYEDDFFAGKAAATVHELGKGKVYYLGTIAEESFYLDLFRDAVQEAGVNRLPDLPEGVQISVRSKGTARYMFIMNLTQKRQTVSLGSEFTSLLLRETVGPELVMDPYGVEIVEMD